MQQRRDMLVNIGRKGLSPTKDSLPVFGSLVHKSTSLLTPKSRQSKNIMLSRNELLPSIHEVYSKNNMPSFSEITPSLSHTQTLSHNEKNTPKSKLILVTEHRNINHIYMEQRKDFYEQRKQCAKEHQIALQRSMVFHPKKLFKNFKSDIVVNPHHLKTIDNQKHESDAHNLKHLDSLIPKKIDSRERWGLSSHHNENVKYSPMTIRARESEIRMSVRSPERHHRLGFTPVKRKTELPSKRSQNSKDTKQKSKDVITLESFMKKYTDTDVQEPHVAFHEEKKEQGKKKDNILEKKINMFKMARYSKH